MPELYDYQKDTITALAGGKHFCIAGCGLGKTNIGLHWAHDTQKRRVLVVTQASVRDAGNYQLEAEAWLPDWLHSLTSFEVISWQALAGWTQGHWDDLTEYAIIFDEIAAVKQGVGSLRGKAFLQIASRTDCWRGFTATPGDKWIDFYAYFTATKQVKNKTAFKQRYCIEQHYPFPDIIGYNHEDELKQMWRKISYVPDSSAIEAQLPPITSQTVVFKQPSGYKQLMKTRTTPEGEFLDNASALAHACRRLCLTSQKLTWIKEFIEGLGTGAVIFYTYTEEGDKVQEVVEKVLKGKGKVWRIDGQNHDIPTPETFGDSDVVLVQWQAGSLGLNLQFINYWVSVSPNYSYSITHQARKRIHRLGQDKKCHYYFLRCEHTIEENVYKILHEKKDFSEDTWFEGLEN